MTELGNQILLMRVRLALLRNRPAEARRLLATSRSTEVIAQGEALLADWSRTFGRSPAGARATYIGGWDQPDPAESEARYEQAHAIDIPHETTRGFDE